MCWFTYISYINCRRPQEHQYETWEHGECFEAGLAGTECVRSIADYFASEPRECEEYSMLQREGRRLTVSSRHPTMSPAVNSLTVMIAYIYGTKKISGPFTVITKISGQLMKQ
ncbi:hypothetical protein E6O75_ATG10942 [Venturia nashicola]|uniref:Uncharacterized protein n=1 Tax=Venturia nashicola TaxID=86259 RepID=A0A4Z1P3V5_9PEZI|nr:hypothetical protein E6O75_ATG10942 [Venturia nashicola]